MKDAADLAARARGLPLRGVSGESARSLAIATGAAILYGVTFVLISHNGYGDNGDNYGMLRAWQEMIARGIYVPSRFQGNLPSELVLGYLAALGGPAAANGFSFVTSIVALSICGYFFLRRSANSLSVVLAVISIALNPFWMNAASTSMDYVQAIAFFLAGCLLLERGFPVVAALLLALAGACRVTYAPLGLAALAFAGYLSPGKDQRRVVWQSLCVFICVCALFYLPVSIASHLTLGFLQSARPVEQGFAGLIARSLYKSAYLYGLPGSVVVLYGLRRAFGGQGEELRKSPGTALTWSRGFDYACLGVIGFHVALFLYIPVRIEYLLPVVIAVAGLLLRRSVPRVVLVALVAAELSYWFISVDLLRVEHRYRDPCAPVQAVGAVLEPHVVPGVLLPRLLHQTDEGRCLPQFLLVKPLDIHDRLPRPRTGS